MAASKSQTTVKPLYPVRRFDIFAEWNRLKGSERLHLKAGDARAYGIAVAKVVAGRSQKRSSPSSEAKPKLPQDNGRHKNEEQNEADDRWWEKLGSDADFKRNIVRRMGEDFYKQVFAPAVREAWDRGATYQQIRDTLRSQWNE